MAQWMMSGLVIATGLISTGVGVISARHRLRAAGRTLRKTETLSATLPDGWATWFLEGFSSLTVGAQWLWATLTLLGWTLAGAILIGLGLTLWCRV